MLSFKPYVFSRPARAMSAISSRRGKSFYIPPSSVPGGDPKQFIVLRRAFVSNTF